MADVVAVLAPWAAALVGFVILNWVAVHQIQKRFFEKMEERGERLTRMQKAMRALQNARAASRRDRIDRML
jgi:membrane protein implicated in regulation of membrane protease activity